MGQAQTNQGMHGYDNFGAAQQNFFTWDQLIKVIPKLPDLRILLFQKGAIKHA